jgi:hypothetical protein
MGWFNNLKGFLTVESIEASQDRLVRLASIVDKGLRSYVDAGRALREIRDRELFKLVAPTFEQFCLSRWKMTPQHANRIIAAAEVADDLEPTGSRPLTERQARPLAGVPREHRAAAFQEAIEMAGGGEPTSVEIETAARKRRIAKKKAKQRPARPVTFRVPGGVITVTPGRAFTSAADLLRAALSQAEGAERRAA